MIELTPERLKLGYFTINDAAKVLNIQYQTVRRAIKRGAVPRPSHRLGRRHYYLATELDQLKQIFESRKRYKGYSE